MILNVGYQFACARYTASENKRSFRVDVEKPQIFTTSRNQTVHVMFEFVKFLRLSPLEIKNTEIFELLFYSLPVKSLDFFLQNVCVSIISI